MSGGANKRREVLKFEGDDINEYMDGPLAFPLKVYSRIVRSTSQFNNNA
jgi:hypothetical protein